MSTVRSLAWAACGLCLLTLAPAGVTLRGASATGSPASDNAVAPDTKPSEDNPLPLENLMPRDKLLPSENLLSSDNTLSSDNQQPSGNILPSENLLSADNLQLWDNLLTANNILPADNMLPSSQVLPADSVQSADKVLVSSDAGAEAQCERTGPCRCRMSDGSGEIDLMSVAKTDGSTAAFKAALSPAVAFHYNPCVDFTGYGCNSVICCLASEGHEGLPCGSQSTEAFVDYKGQVALQYEFPDSAAKTTVVLECSETQTFSMTLDMSGQGILGTLSTKCACPGACAGGGDSGGGGGGLSTGSILTIAFFSGALAYLTLGAAFLYARREARGADLLPNRTFWAGLPGLVKEGGGLVLAKTFRRGTYQEV